MSTLSSQPSIRSQSSVEQVATSATADSLSAVGTALSDFGTAVRDARQRRQIHLLTVPEGTEPYEGVAMSEDQNMSQEDVVAAASDGAYTLLVADFADTSTAWDAYEMLKSVEDGKTVAIEGVVVVKREADGKARGTEGHRPQHAIRPEVGRGRRPGRRRSLPTVAARQCRSRRRGRCGHGQDSSGAPPQRAGRELED